VVPDDYAESIEVNRLAYRVVREGLRNVVEHARAGVALVEITRVERRLHVRVSDDGVGLQQAPESEPGHLGIKLLADTLQDFGGWLELRPAASGGTELEASFPVPLFGV
jgi:signal transduction histidine kinase